MVDLLKIGILEYHDSPPVVDLLKIGILEYHDSPSMVDLLKSRRWLLKE